MKRGAILHIIIISFLLSCINTAFAQVDDLENIQNLHYYFKNNKFETGATFNTFAESNSINNRFISALYGDQLIENELKSSNKLKPMNYIGNQDNANVYFAHMPDSFLGAANMGYRVGLVYHNGRDMKFTDDLFNLMFYGNKRFAGDTADISNLQLNLLTYQELQFGIFQKTMIDNNPFTYYIGLSFIKGQEYNSLRFKNATLFTEEIGEYIELDLSMTYQGIDTVKAELMDINGLGGALNFACMYTDNTHNITYSLSVSNIGFIRWKNTAITIPLDTVKRFEGFEIDNVFDMGETSFTEYDTDTIITDFFSHTDTSSYTKVMPERIHFSATKAFNDKLSATLGCGYYYNANARMPLIYLSSAYKFTKVVGGSIFTGYGGYGSYQLGLGLRLSLMDDKLAVKVSSNNLLGLIIPEHSFSQNVFISLAYRFGSKGSVASL